MFKLLSMFVAEPFVGTTGDQMHAEMLSRGGLCFYQIMPWKGEQAIAVDNLCNSSLAPNSLLKTFNDYVINLKSITIYCKMVGCFDSKDIEFERNSQVFARFIADNEEQLLEQMQVVRQAILQEYNLLGNLLPRLRATVFDFSRLSEMFCDYQTKNCTTAIKQSMFHMFDNFKAPCNLSNRATTMLPDKSEPNENSENRLILS